MTKSEAFKTVFKFLTVVQKGNSLQNPAFWKTLQLLLTTLASIAPLIAPFYEPLNLFLQSGGLEKLITAVGVLNIYFTAATTTKIGV
jgi:hypothetical protein